MKSFFLAISLLFLIGCGGSSSSIPSIDNSTLSNKSNSYGYYGDGVKFGEYKVNMQWKLCGGENRDNCFDVSFRDDGKTTIDGVKRDYGVSKDGRVITFDGNYGNVASFTIKSTSSTTHDVSYNGKEINYKCYNVEFSNGEGSTMIDMCPWTDWDMLRN